MVLTRSPLEPIGMNGAGASKRRSARLSAEGAEENEPPAKKSKANGAQTTIVSTKEQDGETGAASKKKRKGETSDCLGFGWVNAIFLDAVAGFYSWREFSMRCIRAHEGPLLSTWLT